MIFYFSDVTENCSIFDAQYPVNNSELVNENCDDVKLEPEDFNNRTLNISNKDDPTSNISDLSENIAESGKYKSFYLENTCLDK